MICGYLFTSREGGRSIGLAEAVEWLNGPPRADCEDFAWLHFDLSAAPAKAWMQTNLSLVPEFFEALQEGSRSTRVEDAQDNLLVVVNDVA